MLRSLIAAFAVSAVVVGCTSVTPLASTPSAAPVATPSSGPVISAPLPSVTIVPATVAPTQTPRPTATPTASPTLPPTSELTIPPSAGTSPSSTGEPSTSDLLFTDDMSDPSSGWGTGSIGTGDVAYAGGGLQVTAANGAFLWSNRPTGRTSDVIVVAGEATPSSGGLFGLLCDAGEKHLVGAVLATTGEWYFVGIDNTGSTPVVTNLGHGDPLAVDFPIDEPTTMAVVCAGTSTGKLRMELWMPAEGTVATYESGDGPASFDGVGVYGEGTSDGYSALVSQVNAYAVGDGSGSMSDAARALLSHVPSDWQQDCFEEPVPVEYGTSEQTALGCFLGQQRSGAEIAEYASYGSSADMLDTYNARLAAFPPEDADSCTDGSREGAYTIGSDTTEAGRLLCTAQRVGIRFEWTDDQQLILSTLIDFDGDYGATYSDWQNAGP